MKIRWNRNSLRLRITPTELLALGNGRPVIEELCLPGFAASSWRIVVEVGSGTTDLRQEAESLCLHLSASDYGLLTEPDREGVYFTGEHDQKRFAYYLEKDYPCAHPRASEVQALTQAHGFLTEETFAMPAGFVERATA